MKLSVTSETQLHLLSISELGARLRAGALTSEAIVRNALQRIEALDDDLHGFVLVTADLALEQARRADAELAAGRDRGFMHGIPFALKDIIDVAGLPTSCQSKLREGHLATSDSHVARRLFDAGAILLGKANTWQYARGEPGPNLPFPPARNPLNAERSPGGSSSGSGTAVAAGYVRMAIGTDTGGSIRYPAASCGVVGLKPTYGLVGRSGIFPLSRSFDHCGPLAASVEDAAIALQAIAGYDPDDPDSQVAAPADYLFGIERGATGLRIGLPKSLFAFSDAPSEQIAALQTICTALSDAGAVIIEVQTPSYQDFISTAEVVGLAEGFQVHRADLAAHAALYDPPTYEILMRGEQYSMEAVASSRARCRTLSAELTASFNGCDILMLPTMLRTALPLGEMATPQTVLTVPFDVTGHPALAIPVMSGSDGMPLSVQLIGRHFDEVTLFRAGRAIEKLDLIVHAAQIQGVACD